jgi:membrane protease YdiL (CAAX protease family)
VRQAVARWEPAVPVVAGCLLLLVRPHGSPVALAGIYGLLCAMALFAPLPGRADRIVPPAAALAVGFAAVSLAPLVVGPVPAVRAVGALAIALNTGAAVAEEALFRRLLYGRLERWGPVVAIGLSAIAFGAVHVPRYGWAALPVDFGAGLLFGWQRWATGGWGVSAATHAWANFVTVVA